MKKSACPEVDRLAADSDSATLLLSATLTTRLLTLRSAAFLP